MRLYWLDVKPYIVINPQQYNITILHEPHVTLRDALD